MKKILPDIPKNFLTIMPDKLSNSSRLKRDELKLFWEKSEIYDNLEPLFNKKNNNMINIIGSIKSTGKTTSSIIATLKLWIINNKPSFYTRSTRIELDMFVETFKELLIKTRFPIRRNFIINNFGFFILKSKNKNSKNRYMQPVIYFTSANKVNLVQSSMFLDSNIWIIDELVPHFKSAMRNIVFLEKILNLASTQTRNYGKKMIIWLLNLNDQNDHILNNYKVEQIIANLKQGELKERLRYGETLSIYRPITNEKFIKQWEQSTAVALARTFQSSYKNIVLQHKFVKTKASFPEIKKLGDFIQTIRINQAYFGLWINKKNNFIQIDTKFNPNGKVVVFNLYEKDANSYLGDKNWLQEKSNAFYNNKIEFDSPTTFFIIRKLISDYVMYN